MKNRIKLYAALVVTILLAASVIFAADYSYYQCTKNTRSGDKRYIAGKTYYMKDIDAYQPDGYLDNMSFARAEVTTSAVNMKLASATSLGATQFVVISTFTGEDQILPGKVFKVGKASYGTTTLRLTNKDESAVDVSVIKKYAESVMQGGTYRTGSLLNFVELADTAKDGTQQQGTVMMADTDYEEDLSVYKDLQLGDSRSLTFGDNDEFKLSFADSTQEATLYLAASEVPLSSLVKRTIDLGGLNYVMTEEVWPMSGIVLDGLGPLFFVSQSLMPQSSILVFATATVEESTIGGATGIGVGTSALPTAYGYSAAATVGSQAGRVCTAAYLSAATSVYVTPVNATGGKYKPGFTQGAGHIRLKTGYLTEDSID